MPVKKSLPRPGKAFFNNLSHGLVAQLEERRNGIAEVVSSILIGSTILKQVKAPTLAM